MTAATPAIAAHPLAEAVIDAVRDTLGPPPNDGMVALHEPEFAGNERDYVLDCIDTGWVSSVGAYVDRFEAMLAEYTGATRAVAVANGTAALHVALLLAGVEPGDEVLIPALTFVATANAVSYAGAVPHMVDSERETLGIDVAKLARHLAETADLVGGRCINRATGATIRAIVPMHVFGLIGHIEELARLAAEWGIAVVEDAAESLGSTVGARHAGTLAPIAATSFNGNKTITTGGGGAILTMDGELGRRAKHLTTTARVAHRWSFLHDEVGFNYRLPNLNAALGCAQMERLDEMIARKRQLAARYRERFASVEGADILQARAGTTSNYWLVALRLDTADETLRDGVLEALNGSGYMARPVWTPMHHLPMYRQVPRMDLACAEVLERQIVNLPSSAKLAPPA